MPPASHAVQVELVAVLASVANGQVRVMTTRHGQSLPCGPFTTTHLSLQAGMRAWVESETHHPIGYIEQLYTFADPGRQADAGPRRISISYLSLTCAQKNTHDTLNAAAEHAGWRNWYDFFPWEDLRSEWAVELVRESIVPRLSQWASQAQSSDVARQRWQRIESCFALHEWNEDLVLQRYELLYEAALVEEARRACAIAVTDGGQALLPGLTMLLDHRRILATGMARLRAKIKYRPVVFELMPPQFTLLQLQQTAEAITGRWLHKQNFRRLIEQQHLIEETGHLAVGQAGRPAKLFRFRNDVAYERAIAGTKLPTAASSGGQD
ncbi:hypothetical protein EII18_12565 [Comamonadaceae bacterium OH3737_COT-264]|nr:hypothetical protein EII18_12565 [Comamonadaceae bacterium OH3737_COT-264]